ncbi:MAG: hypothetical protein ABI232_10165 [Jatrophihabitantaceae bacterium]
MTDERDNTPEPAEAIDEPAAAGIDLAKSLGGERPSPGRPMTDRPLPPPTGPPGSNVRTSKAAKLEAKAARLRQTEQARAAAAAAGVPPRQRSTAWVVAVSVLGAVAIALAAVVVVGALALSHQRDSNNRLHDLNAAQTQALQVASRYAVDFGSYNYQTLDADFTKVMAELTPSFATNYAQVSASLKSTIEQYKGSSTATVQDIGVAKVNSPTSVVVIVFLDQSVTTSQSTTARIDRNRLEMTLEKQKGTWLISNLLLK